MTVARSLRYDPVLGETEEFSGADSSLTVQALPFVSEGPADSALSGAYRVITYANNTVLISNVTWFTDVNLTKKLMSIDITRNANLTPATVVRKLYQSDGVTLSRTLIENVSYNGVFETQRVRTVQ